MGKIYANTLLDTLIGTGADASLNLFLATFTPINALSKASISYRITGVPSIAKRSISTVSVPYQNTSLKILAPSSTIDRQSSFSVRIDSAYKVLETLKSFLCIDSNGNFVKDTQKQFKLKVEALKPTVSVDSSSPSYSSVYEWNFYDCYITDISQLSYDYNSSSTGIVTVSFIWSRYTEERVDAEDSIISITSESITKKAFDITKNILR